MKKTIPLKLINDEGRSGQRGGGCYTYSLIHVRAGRRRSEIYFLIPTNKYQLFTLKKGWGEFYQITG